MNTLFLAWQHTRAATGAGEASRAWFPIGRLDGADGGFRFAYVRGAEEARQQAGFTPLDAFPRIDRVYESRDLFPLFRNRLISREREDYADYVHRLGLATDANPFEILAISGGGRQTDNLEVFPKIQPRRDGSFHCRFFLHGWRHVSGAAKERLDRLSADERLQVAIELNNPASGPALQLQTADDYLMIGWTPRYLVPDLLKALASRPATARARVVQVNPPPAPHNQRVLIEFEGKLPEGSKLMESGSYQPIVSG
jgi:hypothetical protein